jgi:hypothetical protein
MLVASLPGKNPTARMRVWRALSASGAAALRDGVYVLPHRDECRQLFEAQAEEVRRAGGTAHLIAFEVQSPSQQPEFLALFDRGIAFGPLLEELASFQSRLKRLGEAEARRRLALLRRRVAAVAMTDFFPGAPREQVEAAMSDAEAALNARYAPDEPHAKRGRLVHRDPAKYRGRRWATRERLWIDRIASAWLIRRFIDRKARFVWLKYIKDCPKSAVGFDFDGAEFAHVGSRVTFEVLAASFGLDADRAIERLGRLVHYLDVGGVPVPEAPGLAAIVAGARASTSDDDVLFTSVSGVFDALYCTYSDKRAQGKGLGKVSGRPVNPA